MYRVMYLCIQKSYITAPFSTSAFRMRILKSSYEKSVEWTRQRNPRKAPSKVKVPHTIIAIVYKGVYGTSDYILSQMFALRISSFKRWQTDFAPRVRTGSLS